MATGPTPVQPFADCVDIVSEMLDLVSYALRLVELLLELVDLGHDAPHSADFSVCVLHGIASPITGVPDGLFGRIFKLRM